MTDKPTLPVPEGFRYTYWGSCKGTSKDGSPCGQSSIYPNGYCRHHGGKVTPAFYAAYKARQDERFERSKRRIERRARKLMRRLPGYAETIERLKKEVR